MVAGILFLLAIAGGYSVLNKGDIDHARQLRRGWGSAAVSLNHAPLSLPDERLSIQRPAAASAFRALPGLGASGGERLAALNAMLHRDTSGKTCSAGARIPRAADEAPL
jgi:hypothetical protein